MVTIAFIKKIVGLVMHKPMRKFFNLFVFVIISTTAGFSQQPADSGFVSINTFKDSFNIVSNTLLFFDSNNVASLQNLLQQKFVPLHQFLQRRKIPAKLVAKSAYLKIPLVNNDSAEKTIFLYAGNMFDELQAFTVSNNNTLLFYQNAAKTGFVSINMQPFEKTTYILKLGFCRFDYNFISPHLITSAYLDTYKRIYRSRVEKVRIFGYITSGMLFIILLFVLVNYFLTRKKEFLYYLGYAGFNFLLMLLLALLNNITGSISSLFNGYLDLVFLILSGIFYLAFTRHFLATSTHYKTMDKYFKSTEFFLLLLLVLFSGIHYFTDWYFLEALLENVMKVILLGIGVVFISSAIKQKNQLFTYLAVGNAFAIFFSAISLVFIWIKTDNNHIYRTAIFYYNIGVIFSLAFFLLGLIYKNRMELIENLQKQAALQSDIERQEMESQIALIKAQQEERNRISADMHDDLGAGMTTIRLYSELAKNRLGSTEVPEIEKISSSANELLTKMNAIIWSMSSSNDSLGNMVAYIRSYSLEYFENTGINCTIVLPDDIPAMVVSGAIRRNVFLVVKEALNNIVKHSEAAEVKIVMQIFATAIQLTIHDNGKGIDLEKIREFGNGLKNMKKRMTDVGIQFTIENNNGTLITLLRILPHAIDV